ncbi:MAG: hypothetical protein KIG53_03055 [Oscillospiraceae bacterium]|nr:hypothetical protein [Oscillospiraceae bacterium]
MAEAQVYEKQELLRKKRISSASLNLSALIDDMVKGARKNFKEKGSKELDIKLLKDSVSALKELCALLGDEEEAAVDDSIVITFQEEISEYSK